MPSKRPQAVPVLGVLGSILIIVFFVFKEDSKNNTTPAFDYKAILSTMPMKACVFDSDCPTQICDRGNCVSIVELTTWAERKDQIRMLKHKISKAGQDEQNRFEQSLEEALNKASQSIAEPQPELLEILSLHRNNRTEEKLLNSASDPEAADLQLAFRRAKGIRQLAETKPFKPEGSNDLRLLHIDAHPSSLESDCQNKSLRKAYPSFDARCTWRSSKLNHDEPIRESLNVLQQFWESRKNRIH